MCSSRGSWWQGKRSSWRGLVTRAGLIAHSKGPGSEGVLPVGISENYYGSQPRGPGPLSVPRGVCVAGLVDPAALEAAA